MMHNKKAKKVWAILFTIIFALLVLYAGMLVDTNSVFRLAKDVFYGRITQEEYGESPLA